MTQKHHLFFFFLLLLSKDIFAQQLQRSFPIDSELSEQTRPEFITALQGRKYEDALQLIVPDQVVFYDNGQAVLAAIMEQQVLDVAGLPPGMSFTCSTPDCRFKPGSENYITLQGMPEMTGLFAIRASLKTEIWTGNEIQNRYSSIDSYTVAVQPEEFRFVNESTGQAFTMEQNVPNPCSDVAGIRFMLPAAGEIDLRIFNLIGKEVYRSLINAEAGENDFKLDVREFSPGVYMYTMIYEGQSISRRMVISRK